MMLAVFLFGLFAGREQGISYALASQTDSPVKFPITDLPSDEAQGGLKPIDRVDSEFVKTPELIDSSAPDSKKVSDKKAAGALKNSQVGSKLKLSEVRLPEKLKSVERKKKAVEKAKKSKSSIDTVSPLDLAKAGRVVLTPKPEAGWYVQMIAANTEREAAEVVSKLEVREFKTSVQGAEVNGFRYLRVMVGPYQTKGLADKAQSSLEAHSLVSAPPFVKKIY